MSFSAFVSWSQELLKYDFGFGHPMAPLRLDLTMRLSKELGLTDKPGVRLVESAVASDAALELVHTPGYIEAVKAAADSDQPDAARGLGTEDNPSFPGMHDAAARMTQGTVDGALEVWAGTCDHALNLSGGMHHALADGASGFCIYNDAAVAITQLLERGAQRVMYIDIDAHHGDGVEQVFWNDPRVLTLSIHQSGASLFPGTGFPKEVGGPNALGTAVNLALPAKTESAGWLRALDAVLEDVVRGFEPEIIISQHGCDSHGLDVLSDLHVSIGAQRQAAELIHDLAHRYCHGKWVALGGGGYSVIDVVPLVWTHLLAIVTHQELDLDEPTPSSWRQFVREYADHTPPGTMADCHGAPSFKPWTSGFDPHSEVDSAIRATRQACLPLLGVDVSFEV